MKFLSKILLLLFISFLSTPTIISLIKKNADTSIFFSYAEEEETIKELKEVKAELKQKFDYPFATLNVKISSKIISENLSKHDKVIEEIFSPPPELI